MCKNCRSHRRRHSDEAFFNRNWAGARGGRWVEPGFLADWGCRLLDCRGWGRTTAAADRQALGVALFCKKNQREEGSARAAPVAAPMPKSDSF